MSFIQNHPLFLTAQKICQALTRHGHLAYFAGGCVRDSLIGREAHDIDIATSATPEQVIQIFPKTVPVGKAFGVMMVIEDSISFEVATFRNDGQYLDGRRPEQVTYSSPEEDAKRRDFTMNALFFDPSSNQILDYVGGQEDIKKCLIQAVGDPEKRFQEDHLRILRAIRFSAQLNFNIESETMTHVKSLGRLVSTVSIERIQQELEKMLLGEFFREKMSLLLESQILNHIFPEAKWDEKLWPKTIQDQSLIEFKKDLVWIQFWTWYALCAKKSHIEVCKKIEQMRFSSAQKKCITQALSWILSAKDYQQKSIGELVLLGFDIGNRIGISISLTEAGSGWVQLEKAQATLKKLNFQKPEAFVRAQDLSGLSGETLGAALKKLYLLQLEDVVKTKTEALEFYRTTLK